MLILQYNSQLVEAEGEMSSMSAANIPKQALLPALEEGYGKLYNKHVVTD